VQPDRDRLQPRYRVVIDCDPGVDDALALLAALPNPEWKLDFISTVAGNGPVELVTANALGIVALTGRDDVPVYAGAAQPLARPLDQQHGLGSLPGLDKITLSIPPAPPVNRAVPALRAWLRSPGELPQRLVAIGPLTNIAAVALREPNALRGLDALYVMGGSLERQGGRLSPVAETNFYLDPEAADIVMRSGAPIRLFDYDATSWTTIEADARKVIEADIPEPFRSAVGMWFDALHHAQVEQQRRSGWAVHDLCAVAGAAGVEPGRWDTLRLRVESGKQRGAVVAEKATADDAAAILVARDLDTEAILGFLTKQLHRLLDVNRSRYS
jgi:inosine-uridine nucleoside N-ribohydrolase